MRTYEYAHIFETSIVKFKPFSTTRKVICVLTLFALVSCCSSLSHPILCVRANWMREKTLLCMRLPDCFRCCCCFWCYCVSLFSIIHSSTISLCVFVCVCVVCDVCVLCYMYMYEYHWSHRQMQNNDDHDGVIHIHSTETCIRMKVPTACLAAGLLKINGWMNA